MLALVFGLAGGAMTLMYLKQKEAQASLPGAGSNVPVVVATTDLTFGTVIRAEHLQTVNYPDDSVPPGAYSDPDSLIGQTTKVFVTTKEPILGTKLSSIGGGLSIRIPVNMRATSMNVNVASGVTPTCATNTWLPWRIAMPADCPRLACETALASSE